LLRHEGRSEATERVAHDHDVAAGVSFVHRREHRRQVRGVTRSRIVARQIRSNCPMPERFQFGHEPAPTPAAVVGAVHQHEHRHRDLRLTSRDPALPGPPVDLDQTVAGRTSII
jgi:hypothetical protein